jgi:hypothetical protein
MELQHLRLKLFIDTPERADVAPETFIHIFHGWIQDRVCPELLIDVADYSHVHQGPVVLLIGHEADYGIDADEGRLGLYYQRKAPLAGANRDRFQQAYDALISARDRLEADPRFGEMLRFHRGELELSICDRALAPNTPATFAALEGELRACFDQALGAEAQLAHVSSADARELFRVLARVV